MELKFNSKNEQNKIQDHIIINNGHCNIMIFMIAINNDYLKFCF